jgi:hypothetical protein
MVASGQKIQHRKHLTHFFLSRIGLKTRQLPVLPIAPFTGYEIVVATLYFFIC